MKIQYLGTGAAEGIPAVFCECEICRHAREAGGSEIRTRSQALIDDSLLIDFGPDTYMHGLMYGLDYATIEHCLVTHSHPDHLYPPDIRSRRASWAVLPKDMPPLVLYGGKGVMQALEADAGGPDGAANVTSDGNVRFRLVQAYEAFDAGPHHVTPLPAQHDTPGPFVYMIERGGRTLLYCHDSNVLEDAVLDWLERSGKAFDFVSMDCTRGRQQNGHARHMNFARNALLRDRMRERGLVNDGTILVASHFSHGGQVNAEQARALAEQIGFVAAEDGAEFTF